MAVLDRTWYNTLVDDDGSNTVGSVWDKADVNALMTAVDTEVNRVCVQLTTGAVQSVAGGGILNPTWDAEEFDSHNIHTGTLPYIVIPKAGIYQLGAVIYWDTVNGTGRRGVTFNVNSGLYPPVYHYVTSSVYGTYNHVSLLASLPQNATVMVQLLNDSGASASLQPNSRFWCYKVN